MVLIRRFLLLRQRQKQKFLHRQQRQKQKMRILRRQQRQNLHEHPLILCDQPNDGGWEVPCDGCLLPLLGAAYICNRKRWWLGSIKHCKFFLHKVCAELPKKIIHFLHPTHPLTLFPKNPYISGYFSCNNCSERVWGFDYHCSFCKFDLCIQCLLLQQKLHEHPLILCDQPNDGGWKVPCDGCLLPLSGAAYICTQERWWLGSIKQCKFVLHKVCAELPNKIIHFFHPNHPLTLFTKTSDEVCFNCAEIIWGFGYRCSKCNLDVCIQCAPFDQIVNHEGHEHSFKLHRPTSLPCDACGEIINDLCCICTTCLLLVHQSCALLPPTIKHVDHDHPLSLFYSVQLNDPMESLCKACDCNVDTCYWCYYCDSCTYIVHLDCVTSETKLGDDEHNELGSASASVHNECTIDLISNDLNEISLTKIDNDDVNEASLTQIERVTELQHFSHQHSLTLSDDEPDSEEICDGCVQTISAPFYKCAQCNYFLHVSCAELPNNIRHLLHHHSLTLFSLRTWNFVLIGCRACHQNFNGFAYGCKNCKFYIDLKCISFSGTLRHEAHEHTLSLDKKYDESRCNSCGSRCFTKFRCDACDFNLDLRCAALPSSVRHKWDKHPLKLTFSMIEDKRLGKYYCDFCEERRDDLNHWFYYCEDCDNAVHPECLLGTYTMIKFGKSCESDNCPHLLTLVKNTRLPHRSGNYCDHEKDKDNILMLECADCNVHDHLF